MAQSPCATWLPSEVQYVVKDFHEDAMDQCHSFAMEFSIQSFHRGINRCIAQTIEEP